MLSLRDRKVLTYFQATLRGIERDESIAKHQGKIRTHDLFIESHEIYHCAHFQEMQLELRAVSVQNFTSPASNLSVRFHRDEFSTIPKLLLSKVSELQLFDLDDHSATRDVFFPLLSSLTSYDLMSVPLLL